jgi:hypothetical protein
VRRCSIFPCATNLHSPKEQLREQQREALVQRSRIGFDEEVCLEHAVVKRKEYQLWR